LLVCLAVYVLASWVKGRAFFGLALCSCFDVFCTPTSLDNDKGRGKV